MQVIIEFEKKLFSGSSLTETETNKLIIIQEKSQLNEQDKTYFYQVNKLLIDNKPYEHT